MLRQAGYEVLEAVNGLDAIAMVNERHPALVLLDVNLPDISGLDVCRRIKSHPQASATPVLHISATAVEEQDLITGLQAADAYVVEPVQPEILLAFVGALLRGSELLRQWVAVFDALADGVALLSSDGNILRCNSAFCRLLGKRIGEVLGKNISEVVEAKLDRQELSFTRSIQSRQSETVERPFGDKTYRFSSHLALVRGNVAGAIYIISDVTEERRASREKEEAFALLRALTDSAPVGFAFFDREMRYRLVNKELARTNGVAAERHIGRTPQEIVPSVGAEIQEALQKVMKTGHPELDRELIGETAQAPGQVRSWMRSWYPVCSADGRLIGVGSSVVETTEQKRAEEARQDLERRMLDAQKLEASVYWRAALRTTSTICSPAFWEMPAWAANWPHRALRWPSAWTRLSTPASGPPISPSRCWLTPARASSMWNRSIFRRRRPMWCGWCKGPSPRRSRCSWIFPRICPRCGPTRASCSRW